MKNSLRIWGVFGLVQAIVCFAVYGSALWGERILAPLDIAPAIFPAYRFVDPTSKGVPDNHYIIDQLTYDLPLQTVIYDAYRRGEIPWWDPYTYGGRPLLADAHINGTDPIRILCYLTLPFVLAYNWNLILHSLLAAAGMFALLRFWRFGLFTCVALAVAWQFSGAFVMHFGHPWIAGTFVWFPFIWVCWERALLCKDWLLRQIGLASLLCAASLYSGNLQSNTYLPVLGLAFIFSRLSPSWAACTRTAFVVVASGILGAAMAAPVIANQMEFFFLSSRATSVESSWWQHPVRLFLSLSGAFPWPTGTFRTLDLSKFVGATGVAWLTFCGSAISAAALLGLFSGRRTERRLCKLWKTSTCFAAAYLLVVSTPLSSIFYLRIAPLGVLGIIPLAAIGLDRLLSAGWVRRPKLAIVLTAAALTIAFGISAVVFLLYPSHKKPLEQVVLASDASNASFPNGAEQLRRFQIENLPFEISLLNPESLLSLISLLLLTVSLGFASQASRALLVRFSLILSLVPLLHFASRFIPDHSATMWDRLTAGGPAQAQACELVRKSGGRIFDKDMTVFPLAMGALQRVHTVHGYSALQPTGIYRNPDPVLSASGYGADYIVELVGSDLIAVKALSQKPPQGRFVPSGTTEPTVARETLNSLHLTFGKAGPTEFRRTDTPYPGWRAHPTAEMESDPIAVSTKIRVELATTQSGLQLLYQPTYLMSSTMLAAAALVAVIALFLGDLRKTIPRSEGQVNEY